MKVSLITTLFNEADNIRQFLESYKRQTMYADEFIIVDGGSTDGTAEIIREYAQRKPELAIQLVVDETCSKSRVKGPVARGRNRAIGLARHDIIAVTDAGCLLKAEWLAEITSPFASPRVDVVAGWYLANVSNDFQARYAADFMISADQVDPGTFLPSSRSIAFKKACWAAVGGYPEESLTAEDTVFDIRLKAQGCRMVFNPAAIVLWDCPASPQEAVDKSYAYAVGDGYHRLNLRKFLLRNLLLLFPMTLLLSPRRRRNFVLAYRIMAAYQRGYLKGLLG